MKPLPVVAVAAALFAARAATAPAQEPIPPTRTAPVSAIGCAFNPPARSSPDAQTAARPFDPSASGALSVGQMTAAWEREIARLFPDLGAGGG